MTQEEESKAKRTRTLKVAVALGISQWGKNAAREMVPEFALGPSGTISALARAIGVNRSSLSLCLGAQSPKHDVRRKLEDFMDISTGGMTDVLSVIEEIA